MTNSLSQTAGLTCSQCGRTFTANIWLIADASERPVDTSATHQEEENGLF